jgi:hypothetical protein
MTNDKRNRVFWLGMHVVLTKTELPRLRALGYEVFNPPYLADVYDQSAVIQWDRNQQSTLPPEVFAELSQYNFFYNRITPRIAELLNEYFGTVIVTISPSWLESVLEVYKGRIIYRVYGQPGTLSETLWVMKMFRSVQERDNFFFVPHAEEAITDEHAWLKTRMSVVPYTIPLDVFEHENTWSPDEPHASEIMACCPNIDNPQFAAHYKYLNEEFPEKHFKLYGVQPRKYDDPRVVGTLPRDEQLSRYRRAAGYWYHYDFANSCYLPPIEMMTVGGPVIYMRGSLLAKSFAERGPGEAGNEDEARRKIRLLLNGDRGFIDEVRDSQAPIVRRYHPDHVHPIFDRTFKYLLDRTDTPRHAPAILPIGVPIAATKRAVAFFHAPGEHVAFSNGKYEALAPIARTVGTAVGALLEKTDHEVVVTCFAHQLENAYGYLNAQRYPGRLHFQVLNPEPLAPRPVKASCGVVPLATQAPGESKAPAPLGTSTESASYSMTQPQSQSFRDRAIRRAGHATITALGKSRVLLIVTLMLAGAALQAIRLARLARRVAGGVYRRARALAGHCRRMLGIGNPWLLRRDCVEALNAQPGDVVVIVPDASRFPEALLLKRPVVLCLPDGAATPVGGLRAKVHAQIRQFLSERASEIVQVSQFQQSRLFAAQPSIAGPHRRWPTGTCDDASTAAGGKRLETASAYVKLDETVGGHASIADKVA